MASLSTVIQGLLVAQLPEYEISNDAIGYLCNFSEKLLDYLINKARHNQGTVSGAEMKGAVGSTFPSEWLELILSNAAAQITPRTEERDSLLKQEISDFELIDDGHVVHEVERSSSGNLFLSGDFIKSFLPPDVASRLDSDGRIYLSVSIESVLSKFIQQAPAALQQHKDEDQMVITQRALVEAMQADSQLAQLAKALSLYTPQGNAAIDADFEPIEDETLEEEIETEDSIESLKTPELSQATQEETVHTTENMAKEEKEEANEEFLEVEKGSDDLATTELVNDELLPVEEPASVGEDLSQASEELSSIDEEPALISAESAQTKIEPAHGDADSAIANTELAPLSEEPSPISEEPTPASSELAPVDEELYLPKASPSELAIVKKPVVSLFGRCCPYFDVSTFAIHLLSSIMELFIRQVISETNRISHPHRKVLKQHIREVVRKLTTFQSQMLDEISHSDGNLFNECVSSSVKIVSRTTEWDLDSESYVAEVVLYVTSRILLLASAHARLAGLWIVNSPHITSASLQVISASPIVHFIQQLKDQNSPEGPLVPIPAAPRIRAAEMIYLSSIIRETPLQLDNQLLVIFVFLVTLSIHTLCCVR
eukprot:Phypoly_transcript_04512.p1 GENE.Phypoly_transcript_04512~~Phypoly_transcript_04512.p1  ORF type:complete len:601 (+),score=89.39 Phypoly_transcript_04512:308-2110(+)